MVMFIRTESKEQEVILKAKNRKKKNLSRYPNRYQLRFYTFYRFFRYTCAINDDKVFRSDTSAHRSG